MNDRVKRMKDRLRINRYPLCIEKFRIANETLEVTEGMPQIIRRAKIHANVLENITIFIEEDDLIAGAGASKPFGLEIDYEYGIWTPDEVEALKSEVYTIDPEDEKELYELNDKFSGSSLNSNLVKAMGEILGEDERLWPFMKSSVVLPPWKDKEGGSGGGFAQSGMGLGPGFFLVVIDFEKILTKGARAIIEECRQELKNLRYFKRDSIEKKHFLEAVIIVYEAWIRFANRYAELAEKLAKEENDFLRKNELLNIAKICRKVPEYPAESFKEAIQSFWFTFLLACPSPTAAAGRFDQYMYPYYRKDIDEGKITDEEVIELIELLRIKEMKMNRVSGKANRKKNAGMAKWHNWTLGGVKADGSDAANELTSLVMKSALDTQLPHFTCTLRVHKDTSLDLIVEGLKVVRTGLGMPAFVGDESYIKFFEKHGCATEDARDYAMTGCLDGNIPALTRTQTAIMFIVAEAFDIFMHNGYCPFSKEMVGIETGTVTEFKTFEEYEKAFYKQMDYLLHLAAERCNVEMISQRALFPDPFRSSLMKDGIKLGKDMLNRTFDFDNAACLVAVGVINVADSMAAVKDLVFDKKKYTMSQLMEALEADWIGYEQMHKDFLRVPKYGNNEALPDLIASNIYQQYAKLLSTIEHAYGGYVVPTAISITAHQPGGLAVGALPDGRKAKTILADGSMSPMQGRDMNGPLAVLHSAMKINQDEYQATLLNMKFHPTALQRDEDLYKLASVMKTYFTNGGKHIQFNVIDQETLIEAQKNPDDYRDVVVRVAGYSAYFTALTKEVQDEVINRTGFKNI
ncbi:pyruvate formate lyase family protein [Geosporobacter ferrireducens]|uniref:Pyruvate formate-lyase n=1 Tax=Geosporobacter ferrireducens TaxID=1424294 RepID=A0A1D8GFY8_9FIRM|nr:pyruvate formate lyase family protein [Geosporobacter ferrireducens]AOT69821.1 hypothetical protein Gferi_09655 [Geosporobacter ferrireducens]